MKSMTLFKPLETVPLSLLQLHHLELSLWIFLGSVYILVFKNFINVNIFCIFFYEQHFIGKST